ncbi:unnamed protein product [Notodromas monacha]|uniref:Uncharacterized protein n=1 Tax=Notodromas monacha TaxID=399045 RepID=A0A7R9BWI9_9CRUS|nr:unnamed protein product [Notodromas monacha]CAG0921427.1 unnamed protein product [Notodromas monacha]
MLWTVSVLLFLLSSGQAIQFFKEHRTVGEEEGVLLPEDEPKQADEKPAYTGAYLKPGVLPEDSFVLHRQNVDDKTYHFAYVAPGQAHQQQSSGGIVTGSYSHSQPGGEDVVVNYVADSSGYRILPPGGAPAPAVKHFDLQEAKYKKHGDDEKQEIKIKPVHQYQPKLQPFYPGHQVFGYYQPFSAVSPSAFIVPYVYQQHPFYHYQYQQPAKNVEQIRKKPEEIAPPRTDLESTDDKDQNEESSNKPWGALAIGSETVIADGDQSRKDLESVVVENKNPNEPPERNLGPPEGFYPGDGAPGPAIGQGGIPEYPGYPSGPGDIEDEDKKRGDDKNKPQAIKPQIPVVNPFYTQFLNNQNKRLDSFVFPAPGNYVPVSAYANALQQHPVSAVHDAQVSPVHVSRPGYISSSWVQHWHQLDFEMASMKVAVICLLVAVAMLGQTEARVCEWIGHSPVCFGDCPSGTLQLASSSSDPVSVSGVSEYVHFGYGCWIGEKKLCCGLI